MRSKGNQKWIVGITLTLMGMFCMGCGSPPIPPKPTVKKKKEDEFAWRSVEPKDTLTYDIKRRLKTLSNLKFQEFGEDHFLKPVFNGSGSTTHFAFFVDGKAVSQTQSIPSMKLFCGLASSQDMNTGLSLDTPKDKNDRTVVIELRKLAFSTATGWGTRADNQTKRTLLYYYESLKGKHGPDPFDLWRGHFMCGVFVDGDRNHNEVTNILKKGGLLFHGTSLNTTQLLKALGPYMRYEIYVKKPKVGKTTK